MNTTRTPRAPYDVNEATLPDIGPDSPRNARNYAGQKEEVAEMRLVIFDKARRTGIHQTAMQEGYELDPGAGLREAITVRWWMGRSANASMVYCSVWVRTRDGGDLSGRGSAGGYGYHKESAAFDDAVTSAGIKLRQSVHGCGDGSVRHALQAIAKAAGYGRLPRVVL